MTNVQGVTPKHRFLERVRKSLTSGYKIAPPEGLIVAIAMALEASTQDEGEDEWIDDSILWIDWRFGFDWSVPDASLFWPDTEHTPLTPYPGQPPELFVFGKPGVDGISYGFLVHAPECINDTSYMVAEYNPADSESGVQVLGQSFEEGMQTLLQREQNRWRGNPSSEARVTALKALTAALGITLEPHGNDTCIFDPRRAHRFPNSLCPVPPMNYKYSPTPDNIGVLAPAQSFAKESHPYIPCDGTKSLMPFFQQVQAYFDKGHPASALCMLRVALELNLHEAERRGPIEHAMAKAYRQLNRPVLAERVCR